MKNSLSSKKTWPKKFTSPEEAIKNDIERALSDTVVKAGAVAIILSIIIGIYSTDLPRMVALKNYYKYAENRISLKKTFEEQDAYPCVANIKKKRGGDFKYTSMGDVIAECKEDDSLHSAPPLNISINFGMGDNFKKIMGYINEIEAVDLRSARALSMAVSESIYNWTMLLRKAKKFGYDEAGNPILIDYRSKTLDIYFKDMNYLSVKELSTEVYPDIAIIDGVRKEHALLLPFQGSIRPSMGSSLLGFSSLTFLLIYIYSNCLAASKLKTFPSLPTFFGILNQSAFTKISLSTLIMMPTWAALTWFYFNYEYFPQFIVSMAAVFAIITIVINVLSLTVMFGRCR